MKQTDYKVLNELVWKKNYHAGNRLSPKVVLKCFYDDFALNRNFVFQFNNYAKT